MSRRGHGAIAASRRTNIPLFTETFDLADGSPWATAEWTNKRITTGGVVDVNGARGRLQSGTVGGYAGFAGIFSTRTYSDFEMRAQMIVGSAVEWYGLFGFRASGVWSSTHASGLDSYWLEFKRDATLGFYIYKRVGNTPTLLASSTGYTYATNDVINFSLNVLGTSCVVNVWKNTEAESSATQLTCTLPSSPTSGYVYVAINGGNDTTTDTMYVDNIRITGPSSITPPPPPPPPGGVVTRIGATWTDTRPSSTMDATIAVHDTQCQHIIDFGAGSNLNPSAGVYNWTNLDPYVQDLVDAGATKPVIILCRAPGWMKDSGVTSDDNHPNSAHITDWANLCAAVASRYNGTGGLPNVQYFSVWNEMKGYWNLAQNRWDYEGYTTMYNAVYNAIKAARPTAKVGGPYVILQSGATGTSWSHGPTSLTFPGGSHDQRQIDVMNYFKNNAVGWDFLSCDGGIENQFGAQIPADPYAQIEKLWGWWVWVRQNIDANCELFNFETYVNQTVNAPWNYTQAQREDLYIALARQTKLNVPNPKVTYCTWFHPLFWPQVVNKSSDYVWANTASTFGPKVTDFHTNG